MICVCMYVCIQMQLQCYVTVIINDLKDWGESVSELMIVKKKKQLQETVHSTVLLGCFYLLYML